MKIYGTIKYRKVECPICGQTFLLASGDKGPPYYEGECPKCSNVIRLIWFAKKKD